MVVYGTSMARAPAIRRGLAVPAPGLGLRTPSRGGSARTAARAGEAPRAQDAPAPPDRCVTGDARRTATVPKRSRGAAGARADRRWRGVVGQVEPVDVAPQPVLERRARLPAQLVAGAGAGDRHRPQVARPGRHVH